MSQSNQPNFPVEHRLATPGPKRLLALASGHAPFRETSEQAQSRNVLGWGASLPALRFLDATRQKELFLRAISPSPLPMVVDEEMEQVEGDLLPTGPYVRYDVDFPALACLGLRRAKSLALLLDETTDLLNRFHASPAHHPTQSESWPDWLRIWKEVARRQLNASHFPAAHASDPHMERHGRLPDHFH